MKESPVLLRSQSTMLHQGSYLSCGAEPQQTHPATCRGLLAQPQELWLGADLLLTLQREQSEPGFAIKPAPRAPWTSPLKRGAGRGSHGEGMGEVLPGLVPSLEGVCGAGSTTCSVGI